MMRPGPVVHGALLAAALGFAWQTWTRDRDTAPTAATLTVWPGSGAVTSLALHGTLRDVRVERRGADGSDYFWATVTKTTPPPPKPAVPDGGPPPNMSPAEDKGTTTTLEFPVGEEGEKALAKLAPLKALRDLGPVQAKEEYGLGAESDRLTVDVAGTAHELVLGAKVFGGDDRYVLEPAGGHIFVVAGENLRALDAPEFALRERKLHAFAPNDVAEVKVRRGGKERALVRQAKGTPPPDGELPAQRPGAATWADAATPDKPDQTLANFMERVEQLAPLEYGQAPEAASLTPVGTIEYRGKDGKVLGTVELTKKPAQTAGQFDYYVKSERTRGLAKVSPMAAARVDQDLEQVVK
jgi:hypothetical protein